MKPDYEESIENEDNIASDELLYMEEMEQARIIEQAALAEIELEMAAYPEPDADVPVSYTHLDVYKRQKSLFLEKRVSCL